MPEHPLSASGAPGTALPLLHPVSTALFENRMPDGAGHEVSGRCFRMPVPAHLDQRPVRARRRPTGVTGSMATASSAAQDGTITNYGDIGTQPIKPGTPRRSPTLQKVVSVQWMLNHRSLDQPRAVRVTGVDELHIWTLTFHQKDCQSARSCRDRPRAEIGSQPLARAKETKPCRIEEHACGWCRRSATPGRATANTRRPDGQSPAGEIRRVQGPVRVDAHRLGRRKPGGVSHKGTAWHTVNFA